MQILFKSLPHQVANDEPVEIEKYMFEVKTVGTVPMI
jgi:hypothetical protein